MSEDWLSWDPETIHAYPDAPPRDEHGGPRCDAENDATAPGDPGTTHRPALALELLRFAVAGLVSGLVCGLLLVALVMLLPVADATPPEPIEGGGLLLREIGAQADGRPGPAPLLATRVEMRVSGLIARVRVEQRFENPGEAWVEGVYVFPLPELAAVDRLRMRIGERVVAGRIAPRAEARRVYRTAREAGQRTSLVEQERPNVFTSSVANIGPGESVRVTIEYQQALDYEAGAFRLRFPLVVGPRYIPGAPLEDGVEENVLGWARATAMVPDAARIAPPVRGPGTPPGNPVELSVELDAGFPLAALESPYHPVRIERLGEGRARVRLAGPVPADRDFELVWRPLLGHSPRAALFTETLGEHRYCLLMIMPPEPEAAEPLPREVIYLVDTSGSMAGPSIREARGALLLALERLSDRDRLQIIRFASRSQGLFRTPRPATADALERARRFVTGLEAEGGTEMAPALLAALTAPTSPEHVRQVIFLTDGAVGDEARLLGLIDAHLGTSRLYPIGIGSAPNGYLMRSAARLGRGAFTYIGRVDETGAKMAALFARIEHPALTALEARFPSSELEQWPARIPDLHAGEPLVVVARLPARAAGEITVSGVRGAQRWTTTLAIEPGRAHPGVAALWARHKIAALMDDLARGEDPERVRKQVTAVALEHRLVSRYTSLVAVDVTPARWQGAALARRAIATNLPSGWQHEKVFGALPQTATPAALYLLGGLATLLAGVALRRRALS